METIDTIITNAQSFADAPIDWSLDAGPIWLVGMVLGWLALSVVFAIEEVRRERRAARQSIYRQAELWGQARVISRDALGHEEHIRW